MRTDLVLEHARRAWKDGVGSCADDDEADLIGCHTGLAQSPEGCFLRQVRGRDSGVSDVALADTGSLKDPFVARLDEFLEVGVRQDLRRGRGERRSSRA